MPVEPLAVSQLTLSTDPASLGFVTTADLEPVEGIVGQDRAVEAVDFALAIRRHGFNVYVQGPEGSGRTTLLRGATARASEADPVPDDWIYVHRFSDPGRPRAMRLPAGRGRRFRDAMARLVADLRVALPAAFESDDYRARREAVEGTARKRRDDELEALAAQAAQVKVALVRTPVGVGLAMTDGDEVLAPEAFKRLPESEQEQRRADMVRLEEELEAVLRRVPTWEKEGRDRLAELEQALVRATVAVHLSVVRETVADLPEVLGHLQAVEEDLVGHANEFSAAASSEGRSSLGLRALGADPAATLRRYEVNLLVDRTDLTGAPVVIEPNPTYAYLLGRIEYVAQMGALMTDFSHIRAGALHRANGGYLILDARRLLLEPFAWDGLKRALRSGELRIESIGRALTLVDTVSLEPDPIPLDVKIALVGERRLYDLLMALDPEFPELFKVAADVDDRVERGPDSERLYARIAAAMARRDGLRPLEAPAVARLIEHAARGAGDRHRLSNHMRSLNDLLAEADHLAGAGGRDLIADVDVDAAIEARRRRVGRRRELLLEAIARGTLLVRTSGESIGQVNGLAVHQLGDEAFGWPTRITARARLGSGEVVDIEREVELGGPIHSKGVLILSGYLGGRYAAGGPLSLQASIGFEQSYSGVEGDSASLAELCALLSAIGEIPLSQSIALTGSIDQHGNVQPIGGVNDKVEGFFDACLALEPRDDQGVIIPVSNLDDLMLRRDVVAAAEAGRFRVWAVRTVDEALELLTGLAASEVHRAVETRLGTLARLAREASAPPSDAADGRSAALEASSAESAQA